ncbi:hypothetical protein B0H10DRAFT_2191551 [Mycena sp. CBHHK59/15]|nr:hypothetical protein B0H10DRAFT_2191551 [Mycena sp. CBHHK59/15]
MHTSPFPSAAPILSSTRVVFAPNRIAIAWNGTEVQLVLPEFTQVDRLSRSKIIQEIKFEKEEILDVAVHDDNLFILTGILSGTQWRRQLRRRIWWDDDPWTKDHALYSYGLRQFSLQRRSQTGPTLWLPDQGVNAVIRAGKHAVIVKLIGPDCYVSIWRAPSALDADWHCYHEELTWDSEEEIAHIKATDDDTAPEGGEHIHAGWRYDDGEGEFWAEVLDLSAMSRLRGRQRLLLFEGAFQAFYRVSNLNQVNSDRGGHVDRVTRKTGNYFIQYAFENLGPTFSGRFALLPAVDIDPKSPTPDVPSLRFLCFPPWEMSRRRTAGFWMQKYVFEKDMICGAIMRSKIVIRLRQQFTRDLTGRVVVVTVTGVGEGGGGGNGGAGGVIIGGEESVIGDTMIGGGEDITAVTVGTTDVNALDELSAAVDEPLAALSTVGQSDSVAFASSVAQKWESP